MNGFSKHLKSSILLLAFASCLVALDAQAMLVTYEFRQNDVSGTILSELVLDGSGPYDHTDLVSLVFTDAGNSIFGFGAGLYSGQFDRSDGPLAVDENGGLRGLGTTNPANFWDDDPPPTSNSDQAENLTLRFRANAGGDEIEYAFDGGGLNRVGANGDWLVKTTVIPLPAAVWFFGSGLLGLIGIARH